MFVKSVCRVAGVIALMAALVVAVPVGVCGERAQLWGSLEPGDYAVGFRTIEGYDSSRTFGPTTDYFGNATGGEHIRPIQTLIWYPAEPDAEALRMTVSEYVTPSPVDNALYQHVTAVSRVHVNALFRELGSQGLLLDANNLIMRAARDAAPAEGPFPLVLYFANPVNGYLDNLVMCEYLASHGFVVATTHAIGTDSYNFQQLPAHLEMVVRDIEFGLPLVRRLPFVSEGGLAAFGVADGAIAAWLLQMRNYQVEAVATLDGSHLSGDPTDRLTGSIFFDPARATAPSMHLYRSGIGEPDRRALDTCRYGERTVVTLTDTTARIFDCFNGLRRLAEDTTGTVTDPLSNEYRLATRYLHTFLAAQLKEAAPNETWLTAEGPWPEGVAQVSVLAADELPPTSNQFVGIINTYGMDRAVEVYEHFKESAPGSITFQEAVMNTVGYRFLQGGRIDEAVEAFRMNAETYPNSTNVWDSYADGLMALGDTTRAVNCYRRVLELLPTDTVSGPNLRRTLQANAERALEELAP